MFIVVSEMSNTLIKDLFSPRDINPIKKTILQVKELCGEIK